MQEFGGTGVSDVFTEFVARETNSKKRTGLSGIELAAQILISVVLTQTRDFAAARPLPWIKPLTRKLTLTG
jgi:hypothetical protein